MLNRYSPFCTIPKTTIRQEPTVTTSKSLPKNAYVILGLLSFGEQSGYDLKQLADQSVGHFFCSPVRSQIYSELRRLAELGYAEEREVEQDDRPDKRLYSITGEGLAALRAWLSETPTSIDVTKSHFLLKLFFGKHMDRDDLIAEVEGYQASSLQFLAMLQQIRENCGGEPGTLFTYLTTGLGISHTHANIEWADKAIALLKNANSDYSWNSTESFTGTSK
jgi:DNA-binding PadR family transcriptional regulator